MQSKFTSGQTVFYYTIKESNQRPPACTITKGTFHGFAFRSMAFIVPEGRINRYQNVPPGRVFATRAECLEALEKKVGERVAEFVKAITALKNS